jgi:phospholipid/cholesterol/gamma-HCH transport system ATP-binding protein
MAGLDPVLAAEPDELFVRLRDPIHISILIVTHDLDSVARIADRVTVLDEGRIVMVGTLDEIRHSSNERVQALLTRTPGVGIVDEEAICAC